MRVARVVVPVVAALAAATAVPSGAAQAAPTMPLVGFQSGAWGTYVTAVDKTIQSATTASTGVGCTSATGLVRTNAVATVALPVVGNVGAVSSRITTAAEGAVRSTTASSQTAGVDILGGAVVAQAVTVKSTATSTYGRASGSSTTTFAGLKVLGQSIAANVAPNSRIALDVGGQRVGTVTLNYQAKSSSNGVHTSSARGIMVTLLAGNPYGLPGSTAIYIGAANAGVTTPRVGTSGGSGWGVSATAANGAVSIGRQPHVGVPCFGGTATGSLATVVRDPLVSTGTTRVTTTSTGGARATTSEVVSSVAQPRILGGLISADAIVAEAHAERTSAGGVATTDRSTFVNLKVAGLPLITSTVAPNTTINVLGLGAVTFHKVTRTAKGIEVVMLEITLSQSIAGLPTGTVVQVAGANAVVGAIS